MGSAPWDCFIKYESDLDVALQNARQRALETGEYSCSCEDAPEHDSFEDAMECADADGTCSIIDIDSARTETLKGGQDDEPGTAYALSTEQLTKFFGTDKPSREQIESKSKRGPWFTLLGRGRAIHVTVNQDGKPSEIYFAGMSFD
jgi:hypothetical protein